MVPEDGGRCSVGVGARWTRCAVVGSGLVSCWCPGWRARGRNPEILPVSPRQDSLVSYSSPVSTVISIVQRNWNAIACGSLRSTERTGSKTPSKPLVSNGRCARQLGRSAAAAFCCTRFRRPAPNMAKSEARPDGVDGVDEAHEPVRVYLQSEVTTAPTPPFAVQKALASESRGTQARSAHLQALLEWRSFSASPGPSASSNPFGAYGRKS